jgi:hypothetical protein
MAPIALLVSVAVLVLELITLPFKILGLVLRAYNKEREDNKVRVTQSVLRNHKGEISIKEVRSFKD